MAKWKYQDLKHLDYSQIEKILRPGDEVDGELARVILGTHFDEDISEKTGILQNNHGYSADYIGTTRLHDTVFRNSEHEPFIYCGLCGFGFPQNIHPRTAFRVFIISAFHADADEERAFNIRFARAAAKSEVSHGAIPVVPHLYFPQFLKDIGIEREQGIEAGHIWMDSCDHVKCYVVDGRISEGMDADLKYAALKGFHPEIIELTKEEAENMVAGQGT